MFLHHALALGVFWDENDKEIMKWYCVNYNYLMAYQKNHFMHEILILGYDDDNKSFLIRQYSNHVFQEKEVGWEEVIPFENGVYYGDGVAMKIYKKKNNNS